MQRRSIVTAVALLLGACVIALTVGDHGIGWDESAQATYGELTYEYFASGGEDRRANEFLDLHLYGPLFETVAAAFYAFDIEKGSLSWYFVLFFSGRTRVMSKPTRKSASCVTRRHCNRVAGKYISTRIPLRVRSQS